ncbi:polymorphic toxin-type HINT domain-containing protein [Kitasatospora sp. McL0602]|uniref:polymorphic toxin-type HINT domain-containing protein n=1 Tax=Kitasatospora sp. McL0602 TaxID=3439530 RepID=UPI003F8A99DF
MAAKPHYQVPAEWAPSKATASPSPTAKAGSVTPRLFAAAAATGGGSAGGDGTYSATSLAPSGSWTAGNASGSFTYNYTVQVPPALGGNAPTIGLGYDSASVDGRTSSTNSQSSWIGDGWDYNPGFIERSYFGCDKHGITGSADQCWAGDNASLSLAGHSGELVKDDSSGVWHLKNDDGTKIEFLTGASNGANNGEYVKVSDNDGNAFYFGLNHLPGGDKTDPATNSAWSVPVYSPTAGQPCYDSAKGAASWCNQAWRWNLDYAVDSHGNLTTYNYAAEANYYQRGGGQNNGNGTLTAYTRGGSLVSVAYGQRLSDQVAAKGANKPAAKVLFNSAPEGRCSTAGGFTCAGATISTANASHWPDVPYDQNCASTGTCTNVGPSYWSNTRLASISTQILSGGTYKNVDSYALNHSFPDPGDGTKPSLFLSSIQRTGQDGTPITMPATSFTSVMLPNRVDGTNLVPAPQAYNRPRIQMLTTETGEQTNVDYNLPACSRLNHVMPTSADSNTTTCYNVKWYPPGSASGADPVDDWFNRYTVKDITENDLVGGSPQKITNYSYGPAAWHRNDSALADTKTRTWDQFRGFAGVTTTTGDGNDGPKGQSRTVYLQGMNGDVLASGSTRSITVADSLGENVTDDDWLGGQTLEADSYTQAGGTLTGYTVNRATGPSTTATHVRGSGLPNLVARFAATTTTSTSKGLKADGSWRTTATTVTSDPANGNRPVTSDDTADGLPELCTNTKYATSTNPQLRSLVSEKVTLSGRCSQTPGAANTVAGQRSLYDGQPFGQAGAAGDLTTGQLLDHYDGTGTAQYATRGSSGYDAYGRATSATDPNVTDTQHPSGATTTTVYTPANAGELPSSVSVTSPAPGSTTDWTATTTLDPARALALASTDLNGKTTTQAYDALGRLTAVWLPGQPTTSPANKTYSYAINGTSRPTTVTSAVLGSKGTYGTTTVQLYDGLARLRQTQATPGLSSYHGRMISDAYYDSHGWAVKSNPAWYNDDTGPNVTLFTTTDAQVPNQDRTVFDGQGRPTAKVFLSLGQEQWRSTAVYAGVDRVDNNPVQGGSATSTVTDARGRTTQLWQYRTATATGNAADADITTTSYTDGGLTASRTDSTGKNTWTYSYDLRGRQIATTDPDSGAGTASYDADGRLLTSVDGRGTTLSRSYDLIGRQTGLFAGTSTTDSTKQQAGWTYDSIANGKGKPATTTRYVGGTAGDAYTFKVFGYDNGYRSTGTTVTIPGKEVGQTAAFTYNTRALYDPNTGGLTKSSTFAVADQAAEVLNYSYDDNGPMRTFGSASTTYDLQTDYDAYGRAVRTTVNPWGTQIVSTVNYDDATGRVLSQYIDKQTASTGATQQTSYTYNQVGHVTSIKNVPDNLPAQTDLQCFSYDYLGRLSTAWSDNGSVTTKPQPSIAAQGGCTNTSPTSGVVAPSKTTVGGPAPYWQSYTYDGTGNRTGLVQHDPAGNTANDITITQSFPAAGQTNQKTTAPNTGGGTGGPHALLGSTSTGTNNPGATSYQYDADGNTTSITNRAGTSTLSYDLEGRLASLTSSGTTGPTGYIYGADGSLLVRHSPGKTTIFLGADEVSYDTNTKALTDTRYYGLPDGLTAVRAGTAMTFQVADPHGSNTLALDATTLTETRRPMDPFGNPRGSQPSTWAGDKGFVGGIKDDTTGLTNLGAREYQPATGRFINPDPLLVPTDPQQWNGYAYSDNAPTYLSDPTGTRPLGACDGPCNDGRIELWSGGPGDWTYTQIFQPDSNGDAKVDHIEFNQHPHIFSFKVHVKAAPPKPAAKPAERKCYYAMGANYCEGDSLPPVPTGSGKDMLWGMPRFVPSTLDFISKVGPGCWFQEDACAAHLAEKWDKYAASHGADIHSDMYGDGETLASLVTLAVGAEGAIVKGLRELDAAVVAEDAATACITHSFPAGTLVLLGDGSTKAIQQVKVGDTVQAADPQTGATGAKKVTDVIVTLDDKDFTDLTLQGAAAITTTQHHPFWSETTHRWTDAADLRVGEKLRTSAGDTVTLAAVRSYHQQVVTYNLTVDDLHTYYVVAGSTAVLVHNSGACPLIGSVDAISENLGDSTLFHYTDEAGFNESVGDQGVTLRANARGKVFATQDIQSPAEAEQNLFIGNPKYAGKGDYVIVFKNPEGTNFVQGEQPNELINLGTVRVPSSNIIYAGPNPFQ